MELHVTLETFASLIGLLLYIRTRKSTHIENQLIGWMGLFILVSGAIHVVTAIICGTSEIGEILRSVTWLMPAMLIPFWIKVILDKKTKVSALYTTLFSMLLISVITLLIFMRVFYYKGTVIQRPFEYLPVLCGLIILSRIWSINTKGKVFSSILLIFMFTHIVMSFSGGAYDSFYFIAHVFKIIYISSFFLAVDHFEKMKENTDLKELDNKIKELQSLLK